MLSLRLNGHDIDKIEMIVLGGTWDVYPKQYKIDFIKGLYDACNTFDQFWQLYQDGKIEAQTRALEIKDLPFSFPETIAESLLINETATNRIIGLTVETRPEYVTHENCRLRREMGITRIEMGIQSMFDDVLDANKRGHSIEQVRLAMHILRSYAFKISCHFMP
jgi:histone acetyltransferase (RNA polymerase elongator complex component)